MAENALYLLLGIVYFTFEISASVIDHSPIFVTHVGLTKLFVFTDGFGDWLVSRFICQCGIKLCGSIRRCYHVQNTIIPIIPHRDDIHVEIVHESLPFCFANVGWAIEKTTVDQNHYVLICNHLANFEETVFKSNLKTHQGFLERQPLLSSKIRGNNHGTTFHDQRSSFRDDQNLITELGQVLRDSSKSCGFTCARSSRKQNTGNIYFVVVNIGADRLISKVLNGIRDVVH